MNDIERIRCALNAADDEEAWSAFNRLLTQRDDSERMRQALTQILLLAEWQTQGPPKCESRCRLSHEQVTALRASISEIARKVLPPDTFLGPASPRSRPPHAESES